MSSSRNSGKTSLKSASRLASISQSLKTPPLGKSSGNQSNVSLPNGQHLSSKEIFELLFYCYSVDNESFDPDLILKNVQKVYNFVKGSPDSQDQLRSLGGFTLTLHVLMKFQSHAAISEAVLAISCVLYYQGFSTPRPTFSTFVTSLPSLNCMSSILQVIRQHLSLPSVFIQGCRNIIRMCFNDIDNQNEFCFHGVCRIISVAFDNFASNEEVLHQLCVVTITLSFNNLRSQQQLQECDVGKKLVSVIGPFQRNENLCMQILWAMRNMSHNNMSFCRQLGELGFCESIVDILRKYATNVNLSEHSLALLGNMAHDIPANQIRLGSCGACECLIAIIPSFKSNRSLFDLICVAIDELANVPENRIKFCTRDAIDFYISTASDPYLFEVWSKCLGNLILTSSGISNQFGIFGCCNALLAGISQHVSIPKCVINASILMSLLSVDETNIARFINHGVAKIFVKIFDEHEANSTVLIPVMKALAILSGDVSFQKQVLSEEIEVKVVKCFRRFDNDSAFAEEFVTFAGKIATISKEGQNKLIHSGYGEAIFGVTSKFQDNKSIISLSCEAIANICSENTYAGKHFGDIGICDIIIILLGKNKDDTEVLIKLCWAIENLVNGIEENQSKFYQSGLHALILKITQLYINNEELTEHTFRVIYLLTTAKNTENFKRFNGNSLCEITFQAMMLHNDNIDIIEYCCFVVSNLSAVNIYLMKLYDGGVYRVLLDILNKNYVNVRVMDSCCIAISNLFREQNKGIDDFDKSDTCELMIKILKDSVSPTKVVSKACEVLSDVYSERKHRSKLGLLATFLALIQVLRHYIDIEEVLVPGCMALLRVICYSPSNLVSFWKEGGEELFLNVLRVNMAREGGAVVECVLYCLSTVFESTGGTYDFYGENFMQTFGAALIQNLKNIGIVQQGMQIISLAVDYYSTNFELQTFNRSIAFSGCDLILLMAIEQIENRSIVESGLRSISLISAKSIENRNAIFDAGVCHLLMKVLEKHMNEGSTMESTCWAIATLCDDFPIAKSSLGVATCRSLIKVLSLHIKYPSVVEKCFLAMGVLAELPECKALFDNSAVYELCLRSLNHHRDHAGALCECNKMIAILSKGSRNDSRFLRSNLCESVLKMFSTHKSFREVITSCCIAMKSLVVCDRDDYRTVFCSMQGCALVMSAILGHVDDELMVLHGLDLVEVASKDCHEARLGFINNGLFDFVKKLFIQCLSKSSRSFLMVESAFRIVGSLVHGSLVSQNQFGLSGLPDLFMTALSHHIAKSTVVTEGCKSIYLVTSYNVENQKLFLQANACEVLVRMLLRHMYDYSAVLAILSAAGSMTSDIPEAISQMGKFGLCELTIKALIHHHGSPPVIESGLFVIANCSYGNLENIVRFGKSGALDRVVRIIDTYLNDDKLMCYSCGVIVNLSSCPSDNRKLVIKAGIPKSILKVMSQYASNENIAELCFRTVKNICEGDIESQERFSKLKSICHHLSCCLEPHLRKSKVVLQCFLAAQALGLHDHLANLDYGEYDSFIELLRQATENFVDDRDIYGVGLKVVASYRRHGGASTQICCVTS